MPAIQSSNITALCSKLGFGVEFPLPERDPKVFRAAVAEFREEFSQRGNQLPCFTAHSEEGKKFAEFFCTEENRGAKLWPPNNHHAWPTWPKDRSEILKHLGHIFSLQAYYRYQHDQKAYRQDLSKSLKTPTNDMSSDNESSITVVEPCLKGACRQQREETAGSDGSRQACIVEIDSLKAATNPTIINEFTFQWLNKRDSAARWPPSADPQLKRFMHEHNFYDPDKKEENMIQLVNSLRKGTEIEQCHAKQYKTFVTRINARIGHFTKNLFQYGLIEMGNDGNIVRTQHFNTLLTRFLKGSPNSNFEDFKSGLAYHRQSAPSQNILEPQKRIDRCRRVSDTDLEDGSSRLAKRQKDSSHTELELRASSAHSIAEVYVETLANEKCGAVDTHQNPSSDDSSSLQHHPSASPCAPSLSQPRNNLAEESSIHSTPDEGPADENHASIPPKPQSSGRSSNKTAVRQDLVLSVVSSGLVTLPSTSLRLNVFEFFDDVAKKSGESLESLVHLTFILVFANMMEFSVKQGDEEAWDSFRGVARSLFNLSKSRNPSKEKFEVLVEGMKPLTSLEDDSW